MLAYQQESDFWEKLMGPQVSALMVKEPYFEPCEFNLHLRLFR